MKVKLKINIKVKTKNKSKSKNRSKNRKNREVHMKKGYIIKKIFEKKSITRQLLFELFTYRRKIL